MALLKWIGMHQAILISIHLFSLDYTICVASSFIIKQITHAYSKRDGAHQWDI